MRFVAGLLALSLFAPVVRADDTRPAEPSQPPPSQPPAAAASNKVPLRVVRVMPESHQALLFDKDRGTHVLAELGGTVGDYTVEDIDDDEVILSSNGKEIVLAVPEPEHPASWRGGQ